MQITHVYVCIHQSFIHVPIEDGWYFYLLHHGICLVYVCVSSLCFGSDSCLDLPIDDTVLQKKTQSYWRRHSPTEERHIPTEEDTVLLKKTQSYWRRQSYRRTTQSCWRKTVLQEKTQSYRRRQSPTEKDTVPWKKTQSYRIKTESYWRIDSST